MERPGKVEGGVEHKYYLSDTEGSLLCSEEGRRRGSSVEGGKDARHRVWALFRSLESTVGSDSEVVLARFPLLVEFPVRDAVEGSR